jgi:hypothetical protein
VAPDKDGVSQKTKLESLLARARNDKRRADLQKQLELPPFPSELHHVWRCFIRLSNRRPSTGFGGGMIPFSEIEAFQRLTGYRFSPWEVEQIETLDHVYVAEHSKARKE